MAEATTPRKFGPRLTLQMQNIGSAGVVSVEDVHDEKLVSDWRAVDPSKYLIVLPLWTANNLFFPWNIKKSKVSGPLW